MSNETKKQSGVSRRKFLAAGWGVAVVAGTGCNAWGWDQSHRIAQMTGMGWWMGEAAGAGELVHEALRWVAVAVPQVFASAVLVSRSTSITKYSCSTWRRASTCCAVEYNCASR